MDWLYPQVLILAISAILCLVWIDSRSVHSIMGVRRWGLLVVRRLCVLLGLVCLAAPARMFETDRQAVTFVVDYSRSLGVEGIGKALAKARQLTAKLSKDIYVRFVAAGAEARVLSSGDEPNAVLLAEIGSATDLEAGCRLARAVFPAGASRHLVVLSDGGETRGSIERFAREAAVSGIKIHAFGVAGQVEPDVSIAELTASQTRITAGAAVALRATVEGSISGRGRVRLFENGIAVDQKEVQVAAGQVQEVLFRRAPGRRDIYNYRAVVEGFEETDVIADNNEALAIVDVRGKPLILYVEGEADEGRYLSEAMHREGIQMDLRGPSAFPNSLQELAGYDAVVLSDVPAHLLGESRMRLLRDYVEQLGGGFVMVGGTKSFGVGGYYRTPIEEMLPIKLKAPDEEVLSSALALVIDRSGSMAGRKIEVCKSAAIATTDLLSSKDYIGVYAFDSQAHEIETITKVTSISSIANQIARIGSGGGTNMFPAMMPARIDLGKVRSKIKHMIVLSDGQSAGEGYQRLAYQCYAEGITISTVAVGSGAQVGVLQTIAAAGGGKSYATMDPSDTTRIFTQDTMVHTGRMIREQAFEPQMEEAHPMLGDWVVAEAPPLLRYVKTDRRATAQLP